MDMAKTLDMLCGIVEELCALCREQAYVIEQHRLVSTQKQEYYDGIREEAQQCLNLCLRRDDAEDRLPPPETIADTIHIRDT